MKVKCEFMEPPKNGAKAKTLFKWTTPEVADFDAAKKAAKESAVKRGYTVRAANIRVNGAEHDVVVYVTKKG